MSNLYDGITRESAQQLLRIYDTLTHTSSPLTAPWTKTSTVHSPHATVRQRQRLAAGQGAPPGPWCSCALWKVPPWVTSGAPCPQRPQALFEALRAPCRGGRARSMT